MTSEAEDESQPLTQNGSQPKSGLQPLGKSKNGMLWKKVEVSTNFVNLKGGFSATYSPAPSITCTVGREHHVYVKLCKNEPWFLRGVGGKQTQKGDLKAVNVINHIRIASRDAEEAENDEDTAVAEAAEDELNEIDPMLALDGPDEFKPAHAPSEQTGAQGAAKAKAGKTKVGRPKAQAKAKATQSRPRMQTISMPKHPACSGWDANVEGGKLDIHIYRKKYKMKKDADGCGNATCIYLRTDAINWLLQYAADELMFQGVVRTREQEEPEECNSAVTDVHLDWDFQKKAWTATFVGGVHCGTIRRFASTDLSLAQKRKMVAMGALSKESCRKKASEQFITLWCQAIADGNSREFENDWGLVFETPKKKPRRDKL